MRVAFADPIERAHGRFEVGPMRTGEQIEIEVRECVGAGVVQTADEDRGFGNRKAALNENLANATIV